MGLVVVFVVVWVISTVVLSQLSWFQRREGRDHPGVGADGARLAKDAEGWLSSL